MTWAPHRRISFCNSLVVRADNPDQMIWVDVHLVADRDDSLSLLPRALVCNLAKVQNQTCLHKIGTDTVQNDGHPMLLVGGFPNVHLHNPHGKLVLRQLLDMADDPRVMFLLEPSCMPHNGAPVRRTHAPTKEFVQCNTKTCTHDDVGGKLVLCNPLCQCQRPPPLPFLGPTLLDIQRRQLAPS